jgi:cytochrome c oxidase subunit III
MADSVLPMERLPVAPASTLASGWWGMVMLIITEAALFMYLLFSYYYLAAQSTAHWPPDGQLALKVALPNTFILLLSSVAVAAAERAIRRNELSSMLWRLALGIALGALFAGLQVTEWLTKPFNIGTHAFGSLYYVITGFHMAHLVVGLLMLIAVWIWASRGCYASGRHLAITTTGYYWHFVDAVWLAVFFSFFLWPRMT